MHYLPALLIGLVVFFFGWRADAGHAASGNEKPEPFAFVQISDVHWGFQDPIVNPDHEEVLKKVVAAINEMRPQPDFIVFTGDLVEGTKDAVQRQERVRAFRDAIGKLSLSDLRFVPGAHDVEDDGGASFREAFGETYYSFDQKGVHIIALDSATEPGGNLGEKQLEWLRGDLQKVDPETPLVVFTYRPLFELRAEWGWKTADGEKALELFRSFKHVAVFYGHIHQEHHATVGSLKFHAAPSLMYSFPAPDAAAELAPVPWDPALPWKGLGYSGVTVNPASYEVRIVQYPIPGATEAQVAQPPVTEEQPQAAGEPAEKVPQLKD